MTPGPGGVREQRKVVTALFADVVGSTPLGESLDPEDFMELVGGAVSRMVASVERFGGTVKDLAGDGVLALFGVPAAHEDDPERAVRAGFDIIESLSAYGSDGGALPGPGSIRVRVGIETGLVVLGQVGGGTKVEFGAMGDSVNTAARLQSAAEPGTVVVGPRTYQRVRDVFEWEGPLRLTLKGKAEEVEAYRAVKVRPAAMLEVGTGADIPLVGRDREVEAIRHASDRLRSGHGGVLFVTGEPGIGKSRLIRELRQLTDGATPESAGPATLWLEGRCRSFGESTPFGPIHDLLSRWLEARTGERGGARWRQALEETIPTDRAADVPLLEALVPVPLSAAEIEALRRIGPEERLRRTRDAAVTLLRQLAGAPLVIAVEDLHWADPSSMSLLEHALPLAALRPILFVLTAREEEGPWVGLRRTAAETVGERFVAIRLEGLPEPAEAAMLSILAGSELPVPLTKRLLHGAGGNPLFLEELVRSLAERGALSAASLAEDADPGGEIPATVEQVLISRLDALTFEAHEAVTAAAVIGPQFELPVLEAVTGDPRTANSLAEAVRADLVRPDPERPGEYRFKHALIQEAAYRSLLRRRRRELHAATAAALRRLASGRTDELAGSLARHLLEGGDLAGAVRYGAIAGDRARTRFANAEAIASYRVALRAADGLIDAGGEAPPEVPSVAEGLGQVLELVGRHEEARDAFARALSGVPPDRGVDRARLERRVGDTLQIEYRNDEALGQYELAMRILEAVSAEDRGSTWWEEWMNVQIERLAAFYWAGRVEEMSAVERAVAPIVAERSTLEQRARYLLMATDLRLRQTRYVIDQQTLRLARAYLAATEELGDVRHIADAQFEVGFCHLFRGDLAVAEDTLRRSLEGTERVGDAVGRVRRLVYLSLVARRRGDEEACATLSDQLDAASRQAGIDLYVPLHRANLAWLAWRRGDGGEARRLADEALAGWRFGSIAFPFQWAARWVAVALALESDDVEGAAAHAIALLAPEQQPPPEPIDSVLQAANAALEAGDGAEARVELDRALELARADGYL